MENQISKTVAVFSRPFTVPGFGDTLPAGEYEIETELMSPPDSQRAEAWKASVLVRLHPLVSHPGLTRTLTVSLADLDHARAKDKLSGRALSDFFLEEMLVDPMVRLVMQADGVSEADLRHLYAGNLTTPPGEGAPHFGPQDDPKRHSAVPEAAAGVASVSPQVGAAPLTLPSGGTSS
ncbi:hypothetical protein [Salipiger marinus]|uniref:Uncharacterized protein n=1 Tax=Salipiger marinus TaxID=555512 RepID=A0A1G8KUF9_9RHOB|nr:hypothetical protein [Salipiger marinus]SDI47094.1 hypothetical protein SAMN04487993_100590 [Salipiger marinus]